MTITRLTAQVAVAFVQKKAKLSALEKEVKRDGDQLKDIMEVEADQDGKYEYAPAESPFKLCYSEYAKSDFSWKEEAEALARLHFGKSWRRELKKHKKAAGETTVRELEVRPNPGYKYN